ARGALRTAAGDAGAHVAEHTGAGVGRELGERPMAVEHLDGDADHQLRPPPGGRLPGTVPHGPRDQWGPAVPDVGPRAAAERGGPGSAAAGRRPRGLEVVTDVVGGTRLPGSRGLVEVPGRGGGSR